MPTYRRADVSTCRRIDVSMYRCIDVSMYRCIDTPTHRHTDTPTPAHVASHPGLALPPGDTRKRPPSQHPHITANDYGPYFRDPDGNKQCAVRHRPT
ncbi:hypothetical protein DB771_22765 [Burkholderia sp. AU29985]|nr:hypothetical protein EGY28_03150 [Burkholderia dolosa]PRE43255.1 hypothetical protein C6P87_24940 [Burkholderia sp. AU12872]PUA74624.1 hypothetical protein DB771_22765 [Burkholderia sp. AU29985]